MVRLFKAKADDVMKRVVRHLGELEKSIVYRQGRRGFKISGVFDREFTFVDPDTEAIVATNEPALLIRDSELPVKPKQGDTVMIGKEKFRVIDAQEDGQAGTRLRLHEIR